MHIARRLLAVFLFFIAGVLFLVAGLTKTAGTLVGSPTAAASTVGTVVSSDQGSRAAANFLISKISDGADAPVVAAIAANKEALVSATAADIRSTELRSLIEGDVARGLTLLKNHQTGDVDLRPILLHLTNTMHGVAPAIPASPKFGDALIHIKKDNNGAIGVLGNLNTVAWFTLLAALALAIVSARMFVKGLLKQLIVLGIVFLIPILLLLIGANVIPTPSMNDANAQALVSQVINKVSGGVGGSAGLLAVLGLGSGGILWWWSRR